MQNRMKIENVLKAVKNNYDINIQNVEFFRDGGSCSYTVYGTNNKYFLKTIGCQPYLETAIDSAYIQMHLLQNKFPVIPVILTKEGIPYILVEEQGREYIFIMYDFIELDEFSLEDNEAAGELIGQLHQVMKSYTGHLLVRGKNYFIDRYVEIMKKKNYPGVELFNAYGDKLWEKINNLPRGYCHCELHRGNIHKTKTGGKQIYIVDFDESNLSFPMYDVTLFCNDTDWSSFDYKTFEKSKFILDNFLKGYLRHSLLTNEEISAFFDFIAVFHFQMQPKIMEIYGYDTADNDFFDRQYDLLINLKEKYKL
ncbi:MAG: phosphotransferase [Oscillospiraceae bacterium]|nr:phosphotransferase [Oscillospiraceae bacterium]